MTIPSRLSPLLIALCLGCAQAVAGCDDDPAAAKKKKSKTAAAGKKIRASGLAAGDPALAAAIQKVMAACTVSELGYASACKEEADQNLKKQEQVAGVKRAMSTYCEALAEPDHLLRALAALRINRMAHPAAMKEHADPALLDCLINTLSKTRRTRTARTLARAAAYMAPPLDRAALLTRLLDQTSVTEIRLTGYGALWANGRERVLDLLKGVIVEGKDPRVRIAAIGGFEVGDPLTAPEVREVCAMLEPLLSARELPVAAAAAGAAAALCPGRRDKVLSAAQGLITQGRFAPGYVAAIRKICGYGAARCTSKQKERLLVLLNTLLKDERFDLATRGAALRKLSWIDEPAARKLAFTYRDHESPRLQRAAQYVLRKTGKK